MELEVQQHQNKHSTLILAKVIFYQRIGATSKQNQKESGTKSTANSENIENKKSDDGANLPRNKKLIKGVTSKLKNLDNETKPMLGSDNTEGKCINDGAELSGEKKSNKGIISKSHKNENVKKPTSEIEDENGGKNNDRTDLPDRKKSKKGVTSKSNQNETVIKMMSNQPKPTSEKILNDKKVVITLKPRNLEHLTTKIIPNHSSTRKSVTSKLENQRKDITVFSKKNDDSEGERKNDGSFLSTKVTQKTTTEFGITAGNETKLAKNRGKSVSSFAIKSTTKVQNEKVPKSTKLSESVHLSTKKSMTLKSSSTESTTSGFVQQNETITQKNDKKKYKTGKRYDVQT